MNPAALSKRQRELISELKLDVTCEFQDLFAQYGFATSTAKKIERKFDELLATFADEQPASEGECKHPGCCCVCGHNGKCPECGPCAIGGTFE